MAKTIVGRPLLRVAKNFKRLFGFLEFFFSDSIVRIAIRVMLASRDTPSTS